MRHWSIYLLGEKKKIGTKKKLKNVHIAMDTNEMKILTWKIDNFNFKLGNVMKTFLIQLKRCKMILLLFFLNESLTENPNKCFFTQ